MRDSFQNKVLKNSCAEFMYLLFLQIYHLGKAHKNCIIGQKFCLHHITGTVFIIQLKLYVYNYCGELRDVSENIKFYAV